MPGNQFRIKKPPDVLLPDPMSPFYKKNRGLVEAPWGLIPKS
jgi:hypothetical protein